MAPKGKAAKSKASAKSSPKQGSPSPQGRAGPVPGPRAQTPEQVQEKPPTPPPPEPYRGPRPDEELLHEVSYQVRRTLDPKIDLVANDEDSVEVIYCMIRDGEDVNQYYVQGYTPLALAAYGGNSPLVSLLMEKKADVAQRSFHTSELALHHAAKNGHRVATMLLAEPMRAMGMIDEPTSAGWTALHLACEKGHIEVIRILMKMGASATYLNQIHGGESPIHLAARVECLPALEVLIDYEGDPNAFDAQGRSPLYLAATRANARCVALLLQSKANPEQRGMTTVELLDRIPMHLADGDKVRKLIGAYNRPKPKPLRTDTRFDRPDERDLLRDGFYKPEEF